MMPQKKNPDVPELVRGKTGRIYGNLTGMLTMLKGLPLAYNKDMQEDKEGMFDTAETLSGALRLFAPMIETMHVKKDSMYQAVRKDYSNATDLADYLTEKGMAFRESHEAVGKIVLHCINEGKYILDLTLEELKSFSGLIEDDIFEALSPDAVVDARKAYGGTGRNSVKQQLNKASELIKANNEWHKTKAELI